MIDLIANTGIQFYTVPKEKVAQLMGAQGGNLSFTEVTRISPTGESVCFLHFPVMNPLDGRFYDQSAIPAQAWNESGELDWNQVDTSKLIALDGPSYSASAKDALVMFSGRWIPLPYFKRRRGGTEAFEFGPHAWARMWVGWDEVTSTLDLVLAFDTTIGSNDPVYSRLRPVDATAEGQSTFGCAYDVHEMLGFHDLQWVTNWLQYEFLRTRVAREPFKKEHVSHFLALLRAMGKTRILPEVQLFDKAEEIETSLIIDIGNSRTCGVLAETSSLTGHVKLGTQQLDRLRKLELRNLNQPNLVETDPFEMRLTFHQQQFGNEMGEFIHPKVFQWPSMVRLGKEAKDLSRGFDLVGGKATMSSPKRYLWDMMETTMPWCKVSEESTLAGGNAEALFGLAIELNNQGNLLRKDGQGNPVEVVNVGRYRNQRGDFGEPQLATKARFSRGNLMALAAAELLVQATSQMNSFAFREFQGDRPYRRKLRYVVVTCPTAMPRAEQMRLRDAVEDAVEMLRRAGLGQVWFDELEVIPSASDLRRGVEIERKHWQFDEATSTQLAFIYSQIAHRLNGNASRFFKAFGKVRTTTHGERSSVRVGSIDIGGGTTDMMIAEYFNPSDGTIESSVKVEPLFWEGFNVAGDDLLRSIIEQVVLPGIAKGLSDAGAMDVRGVMGMLFSRRGNQSAKHKFMQVQLAHQVLQPAAMGLLNYQTLPSQISIGELLGDSRPEPEVMDHAQAVIEQYGQITKFDLFSVHFPLDAKAVEETARVTLDGVLTALSNVVSQFDCDLLILTGRPSKLDVVHDMIMSSFPVSPDAIYSLSNYPIGNWYPFTNLNAEITDPKTSVAVGATIGLLGHLNRLPQFQLDDSALKKVISTARYMGVMSAGDATIRDENLFFTPKQHSGEIIFAGAPLTLGFRQANFESWWATPLYHLSYKNDFVPQEMTQMGIELPITIRVERDPNDPETINQPITDATDRKGQSVPFNRFFSLQARSLRDESGYWKDTGLFTIL